MKWVSHVAIAGSVGALIDPALVPAIAAGATAPDWLEWVLAFLRRKVKHRTSTHYLAVWLLAVGAGLALATLPLPLADRSGTILAAFAFGGVAHWFCDAFTIAGVPVGWWSRSNVHVFGGKLRTGSFAEYAVAGGFVMLAAVLGWHQDGFVPFFPDWAGHYESGLIDGAEWRARRFKLL